jgi:hypothetical protein
MKIWCSLNRNPANRWCESWALWSSFPVAYPGYFMNYCRETAKMGVPARHRERSGEAGGPPGNRRVVVPRRT